MTANTSLQPVIQCTSLSKVFQDFWGRGKVLAVDQLELEVYPGEVFGLLGPNGSGKSTTIKMLLGLLYPTSGSCRVFGRPPTDVAIKSRIGFMPEESYLHRFLNAYETLDYYGRLFRLDSHERKRRTNQLIEMVGLKRAGKRTVGTYSKGMARRIGLAQALVNDPDLLILDEPTTGLDPIGTRQIKEVIRTLAGRGKTVLLCSHLLADVEDVCDRVAIMYGGRRRALGDISELLERSDVTQISAKGLDDATIEKLRQMVADAGSEILDVKHPRDRLEDIFLRVVGQAQREKLETSGAESAEGVSSFLAGDPDRKEGLVDSLISAGRREMERAPVTTAPVEILPTARADVLSKLVSEGADAAESSEPVESPVSTPKPDAEVIDRLLNPDDPSASADNPASGPLK
ncbi:MAG: ABC transporter ATP-binding protein [Planctomycetota bacterium]|nr:ABC transporter ATP-binding protein [Planctomycetota bacterium]